DPLPKTGLSGENPRQAQLNMNGGMVPFTQGVGEEAYDNRPVTHSGVESREDYGFEEALPF
ncbi:MAG: hypothetical protein K5873_06930, partial [Treponema sp.]|nr:hypothetical protein [Treponema sp.]